MKNKNRLFVFLVVLATSLLINFSTADARSKVDVSDINLYSNQSVVKVNSNEDLALLRGGRGGGSFGGSRGGGFRSSRPSGGSSFGGSKKSFSSPSAPSAARSANLGRTSFGGSRLGSGRDYTSKYGAPRQSSAPRALPNGNGGSTNYVFHSYGGMGSGFMTGYYMGATSWMWSMPFHPAYYYGRPYEVVRPDGVVEVYPGTFSFGKLFFTLLIVSLIIWLIVRMVRNRRGSSSSSVYGSQSSFS